MVGDIDYKEIEQYDDLVCGACIYCDADDVCINPGGLFPNKKVKTSKNVCSKGIFYYKDELCTFNEVFDYLKRP